MNLVVLISGQGRNLQAIIDAVRAGAIPARLAGVVSNRPDAQGLVRARAAGAATAVVAHQDFAGRGAFDEALGDAIDAFRPDIVALAGFMRILGDPFIRRFERRMLNIHPSLLPRHRGLHTHRRVLEAGEREHGASVHFVTSELDGGPVVIQGGFTVQPHDTEQTLAERVMRDIELKIYPQAIAWMARGELRCDGHQAFYRGRALARPLSLDDLEAPFAMAGAA